MIAAGASSGPGLRLRDYHAVVLDMDGVVTDMASVHAGAWQQLFDEVLPDLAGWRARIFDVEPQQRRGAGFRRRRRPCS